MTMKRLLAALLVAVPGCLPAPALDYAITYDSSTLLVTTPSSFWRSNLVDTAELTWDMTGGRATPTIAAALTRDTELTAALLVLATNLNASTAFSSGRVPIANLATGTPDGTKFIRDDGVLAIPPGGGGTGDVVGPASATDGRIAIFDGVTGKLLKVGTLNEAALALLNAANVFTSTNTFQAPTTFASLIITNLDLLNPIPNRGVSNATPSRIAIFGADNRLTNDIAETGTGAPVRAVSPALTGSPTVPTASSGASNTVAANTEYVDRAVAAGGGGGGGTSVTVNGATVNPAKFTNNAAATGGIILATNANGEILMVATNFPAGGGDASVGVNNVFTGANRFTNATPQSFSRPPKVLGGRIAAWTAPQMTPGTNSSIQAQYRVLGDGVASMEFDGTTSEEISMLGSLGQDPDTGSTVTLTFASDDTANTVCWQAQWQLLTLRGIDTNLLSTAATWTSNIPGTARVPTNITIALNPPTGVIGGTNDFSKPYMLRITRLPGSDSSLSNAYLIAVDHRYAQ